MTCENKGCNQKAQWICSVHNLKFCDTHHRVHYKECKHQPRLIEDIESRLLPLIYKLNDYKCSVINFSSTMINKIMSLTDGLLHLANTLKEQAKRKLIEDIDCDIKPFLSRLDFNHTEFSLDQFEIYIKNVFENNLINGVNQTAAFKESYAETHDNFTQTVSIDFFYEEEQLERTINKIDGLKTQESNLESSLPIPQLPLEKSIEGSLNIIEEKKDQKADVFEVHPLQLISLEEKSEGLIPVNQRLASMSLEGKKKWVMGQAFDLSICKDIQDIRITKDSQFLLICDDKAVGICNPGL